jgi:hypothetical protein
MALVWAWQLAAALLLAAPVVAAVAGTGIQRQPQGDAVLLEPGGLMLVEMLRLGADSLIAALTSSLLAYLVLGIVGLVPLAALMLALAHDGKLRVPAWLGAAIAHFPSFLLIGAVLWLGRALLALACAALYAALEKSLHGAIDERRGDLLLAGGATIAAVLFFALGVAADLARAARVRYGTHALGSLRAGLSTLARRPLAAAVGWLIPASWSLAVLGLAALVVGRLALDEPGTGRVLSAFVVHQLAAFVLVALKALWLRRALELVEPGHATVEPADQAVAPIV